MMKSISRADALGLNLDYTTQRNGKGHFLMMIMMMTYHGYENATIAVSIGNGKFRCHKYGI